MALSTDIVNTAIVDILVGQIKPEINLSIELTGASYQNILG